MPKNNKLQELQNQINEITEALKRERADAVNLRRQYDVQITLLRDTVKKDVILELLPIVDNFERALGHTPPELKKNDYVVGIEGIVKQFERTLSELGVSKIKTVGEPFDPNLHEAVSMAEGKGNNEVVSEELRSGYLFGDEVIRHAMVKVKKQS